MLNNKLTGHDFYQMFKSGVNQISRNKELLNKINVYPVADGDTGSNLLYTLEAAVDYARISDSVTETLDSISKNAISYARGNSGIIFSEFIHGLAISSNHQEMNVDDFIQVVNYSSNRLYEVVSSPIEGTILTVIKEWARFLKDSHIHSFKDLFDMSLPIIKNSVDETINQLKVLKKHRIPDSGALGFYLFVEGMKNSILDSKDVINTNWDKYEELQVQEEEFDEAYRYCTQFFVKDLNVDVNTLLSNLNEDGNSIAYSGNQEFINLHLHTNQPWEVSRILTKYGIITNSKVDDMLVQSNHRKIKGKIGLLTDSIADISKEFLDEHQIHMISINLLINQNTYLDKKTILLNDFFSLIDKASEYPVSSQPNDQQIKYELNHYLDFYEKLIIISVSSKLSGTYSGFRRFLDKYPEYKNKVYLIDSLLNSGGQGLLVKQAAEICKRDDSIEEVIKQIEHERENINTYVVLSTFENLSRSGRINPKIASLANKLNLKAILTMDKEGRGKAYGFSFNSKSIENKVIHKIKTAMKDKEIQEYALFYSNETDEYKRFKDRITKIIKKEPLYCTEISSATALHVGNNSYAIAIR